ncbi:hypothetical protein BOR82_23920 [Klebsiella pneumoniae]|nr:hypothetical protein [Klebsiella pneumoniae]
MSRFIIEFGEPDKPKVRCHGTPKVQVWLLCRNGWTDPTPVDKFCPHNEACSKASGLTPPR